MSNNKKDIPSEEILKELDIDLETKSEVKLETCERHTKKSKSNPDNDKDAD